MAEPSLPVGYFNRFDDAQDYEKHLFVAGTGLQSAELNEAQEYPLAKLKAVSDVLFKDGSIIRDAVVVVDPVTGAVTAESGALYVRGAVRGVAPRSFAISLVGDVVIGVYLTDTVISPLDNPALRDPATGTRNYQETGALRLKTVIAWGTFGEHPDGAFYPVYTVRNGVLLVKEAPPAIDAVNQAISRYDRDSSGGTYVVSGLDPHMLADAGGAQVYTVSNGACRIQGRGLDMQTSRRLTVDPAPDLRYLAAEPHVSVTAGEQVVTLDRGPVANVQLVQITASKTVTMTHGAFSGAMDQIADASVLSITSVVQGATAYVNNTDYKLTAGKVDWSLPGAEVAPGSTYELTYQYIRTVAPSAVTAASVTVTGAVVGSLILVSYNQYLPRIDRLCMDNAGQLVLIKGVSADWSPAVPPVPDTMIALATIAQTWTATRALHADSVRMVPMQALAKVNARLDFILGLVAQQRLESNINLREAGTKKGLFTDPFLDDSQRDQGLTQTAAIVNGELCLAIAGAADYLSALSGAATLDYVDTVTPVVAQTARTGSMKINPYLAFGIPPATVTLTPSVDRWTEFQSVWAGSVSQSLWGMRNWTAPFTPGGWEQVVPTSSLIVRTYSSVSVIGTTTAAIQNLRQIPIHFSVAGFGPGETLISVRFDGIPVTATA